MDTVAQNISIAPERASATPSAVARDFATARAQAFAIIARHQGDGLHWPTLGVWAFAFFGWLGTIAAYFTGLAPLWAGVMLNVFFAYVIAMPEHEALHLAVSNGDKRFAWADKLVGYTAGLVMLVNYDAYVMLHKRHHRFLNDPERDPDYALSSWPAWIAPVANHLGLVISTMQIARISKESGERWPVISRAIQWAGIIAAHVCASVFFGAGVELFCLWLGAGFFAINITLFVQAWLPHRHYHDPENLPEMHVRELGQPWEFLANVATLGFHYHMIHHSFPRIPFSRCARAYHELKPVLEGPGGARLWNVSYPHSERKRAAEGGPVRGAGLREDLADRDIEAA